MLLILLIIFPSVIRIFSIFNDVLSTSFVSVILLYALLNKTRFWRLTLTWFTLHRLIPVVLTLFKFVETTVLTDSLIAFLILISGKSEPECLPAFHIMLVAKGLSPPNFLVIVPLIDIHGVLALLLFNLLIKGLDRVFKESFVSLLLSVEWNDTRRVVNPSNSNRREMNKILLNFASGHVICAVKVKFVLQNSRVLLNLLRFSCIVQFVDPGWQLGYFFICLRHGLFTEFLLSVLDFINLFS